MRVYLAGSMHGLKGYGKRWRDREARWLKQHGVESFSPPDREPEIVKRFGVGPELLRINFHKIDKSTRVPLYREIIKFDLKQVRKDCDAVLVHFTKESAGTCSEITWAFMNKIPVHLVNATGKILNPWVEAASSSVHKSWERLRNHIKVKYRLRRKKG